MNSREKDSFEIEIKEVLKHTQKLLMEKNSNFGDSALNPIRVFSQANPIEQIKVRIDDKLSRLSRGKKTFEEDTVDDLIGYLVLLKIAEGRIKNVI